MDKFVVLFSSKIFIVPAFIMNWTFIYIKLLIYWSSAASFTYQTSGLVVKRTGHIVPAKTATCKYLYFLESFTLKGRQTIQLKLSLLYYICLKNLILSFIHSNYKTSAFLTLFLDKFLKIFTRNSCRVRGQKSESGVELMFFNLTAVKRECKLDLI